MYHDTNIDSETKAFIIAIRNRIIAAIIVGGAAGAALAYALLVLGRSLGWFA